MEIKSCWCKNLRLCRYFLQSFLFKCTTLWWSRPISRTRAALRRQNGFYIWKKGSGDFKAFKEPRLITRFYEWYNNLWLCARLLPAFGQQTGRQLISPPPIAFNVIACEFLSLWHHQQPVRLCNCYMVTPLIRFPLLLRQIALISSLAL